MAIGAMSVQWASYAGRTKCAFVAANHRVAAVHRQRCFASFATVTHFEHVLLLIGRRAATPCHAF